MASSTRTVDLNILDLAADEKGNPPPRALVRRLPAMIAELLSAAGVDARHGSATVSLEDKTGTEGIGWAVAAGLLDEGMAIDLSRRIGPARFLAHGELSLAGKAGLTLKIRVLRREDAKEVLRLERDFFEEEALDLSLRIASDLANLFDAKAAIDAIDPAEVVGTRHPEALLRLQEGLDGLAAAAGGLEGSDSAEALERLLSTLELDATCQRARDNIISTLALETAPEESCFITLARAVKTAQRLVELREDDIEAVLLLTRLLHRQGTPRTAREALVAAHRAAPRSAAIHLELAQTLAALDELDQGVELCREALAMDELEATDAERAGLHGELGLALARLDQLEEAVKSLERSLELQAEQPQVMINLARCRHLMEDNDGALRGYEQALVLDPTAWEAARGAAEILLSMGALEEATVRLRIWSHERSEDPLAALTLGEALIHLGRADEANSLLDAALKRHGTDTRLLALYAGLLTQLGRLDDAEARYREALRLSPNDPALLSNLAVILTQRGALDDAERLATKAVELDPGDKVSAQVLDHIHRFPRA